MFVILVFVAFELLSHAQASLAESDCTDGFCSVTLTGSSFLPRVLNIQEGDRVEWNLGIGSGIDVISSTQFGDCTIASSAKLNSTTGLSKYQVTFVQAGIYNYMSSSDCNIGFYGQILVNPKPTDNDTNPSWLVTSLVFNCLIAICLMILMTFILIYHRSGMFSKLWVKENMAQMKRAQAGTKGIWTDKRFMSSALAPQIESDIGVETALDEDTYNIFYGRLCLLRHDEATFAAMHREMKRRVDSGAAHESHRIVLDDIGRLLQLMRTKKATDNTAPVDGMELLSWGHRILENYLSKQVENQNKLQQAENKLKSETEL